MRPLRAFVSPARSGILALCWSSSILIVPVACSSDEAPDSHDDSRAGSGGNDGGTAGTGPSQVDGGALGAAAGSAGSASKAGAGAGGVAGDAGAGSTAAGEAGSAAAGEAGASGGGGASCPVAEACAGYTLIGIAPSAGPEFRATLIDMEGNLVQSWGVTGFPPKMLPGGSLIGCTGLVAESLDCAEIRQVTWDGALEWSFSGWDLAGDLPVARQHHDLQRQGNPLGYYAPGQDFVFQGTTLVLAHSLKTIPAISAGILADDVIYEVDFAGALTGFEWHAADHFEEFGFDDAAKNDIAVRQGAFTWLHGNSISLLGQNRWFEAGHLEFHPDNILYSSRDANFVVVIARDTGEIVWKIGPDFAARPEAGLGQFVGQHHPHMIPVGLPGAGNILVFENGGASGYGGTPANRPPNRYRRDHSRVLEFDPIELEIVWEYGGVSDPDLLWSPWLSSVQRLPNGNTLITEGMPGRIIEVTPEKQIVWQYQSDQSVGEEGAPLYRSYRVPPEWLPEGVNENGGNYGSWKDQFE